jgi:hypothetical protein
MLLDLLTFLDGMHSFNAQLPLRELSTVTLEQVNWAPASKLSRTRPDSGNLADRTAQSQRDADLWYELYPGKIGGILVDEGWNNCGDNNEYAELHRPSHGNMKCKYPGAYDILCPGDFHADVFRAQR